MDTRHHFPELPPLSSSAAAPSPAAADAQLLNLLLSRFPERRPALRSAGLTAMRCRIPLTDELRARRLLSEDLLLTLLSEVSGLPRSGPGPLRPCAELLRLCGAAACLQALCLPLGRRGDRVVLAVADPHSLARIAEWPVFKGLRLEGCLAPPEEIRTAIARCAAPALLAAAETRLPADLSVRGLAPSLPRALRPALWCAIAAIVILQPAVAFLLLTAWLSLALIASTALRLYALVQGLRHPPKPPPPPELVAEPPVISILVPLFREPDIAPRLLRRLEALAYPRGCLEVLLILEEQDPETLQALRSAGLPGWMQLVVVPKGSVTTKPRAMNYALSFARGSIIGIYDAEDAPDSDQLLQVAATFEAAPEDLACLQGALDYYNPRSNLIARLFTAEYAAWFRVMMPALQRIGFPMPLGGTTLFIRRAHLERLGAWDAHNVTEDADLGIRIARHGLRTQMLSVTTHEEANCRPRPWIRQRSRWIKGYILTWAVHMRNPLRLWRALGPKGFAGYQLLFLGAQSQVLLAPLNWSFWLIFAGLPHPARGLIAEPILLTMTAVFLLSEVLLIACAALGLQRTRHPSLWRVTLLFQFYHLMAAVAGWRALREAFRNPFYWAKTSHGHFDGEVAGPPGITLPDPHEGDGPALPEAGLRQFPESQKQKTSLFAGPAGSAPRQLFPKKSAETEAPDR
ncbi:glycosyltransferase [Falsigemmobacter intermedius]|uniref:Glycosyltransferase n=1 Tax=Falsigemmobacter intermedius TaxID=1553448 RepID=A0A3S3WMZ7_9RHOB|nr:glycosyltransferase [Falsigemmobacter intermedius]RWY41087.1 glycosyltransferase [Falsigemmobacter intermedius]